MIIEGAKSPADIILRKILARLASEMVFVDAYGMATSALKKCLSSYRRCSGAQAGAFSRALAKAGKISRIFVSMRI